MLRNKIKKLLVTAASSAALVFLVGFTAHAATYKVVQGDTLYNLGNLFGTSSNTIMKLNSLSSSAIYPGQVLSIPGDVYTVKSGDTMYLIAKRFGISLIALEKANNDWDGYIYPGQRLNLPGIVSATSQTSVSKGVIPYSQSDVDLLARLVRAEAEDQPYNAKVAVAAVVVNRVKSGQFPNNIHDVIYQRISGYYQFSPVLNGTINQPANQDCINAAYAALNGTDPTNGALFYFDDSATNTWLWSKPVAARIDNMVFVY